LALALAAMLAAFRGTCVAAGEPEEKARYDYAVSLYMRGAFDAAVTEFTNFIKDYPKGEYTDDAYYWLGKYYMAEGRAEEALDQFGIVIALFKGSDRAPAAQFEVAAYHYDPKNPERDYEKAVTEFLKIPFFYPGSPYEDDARYYAALCQLKSGNFQQAVDDFRALIEKYPDSEFASPSAYNVGLAFALEGKPEEAMAAFQKVRDEYPAGLYHTEALAGIELIDRHTRKKTLELAYRFGTKGDGAGELYEPGFIAADPEGRIFVSDTGNSRVQVLSQTKDGLEVVKPSLAQATLDKSFRMDEPTGIGVGPDGNVSVVDAGLYRIQVFTPDGELLETFGKKGSERGGMGGVRGLAVDEAGVIYLSDVSNKRVGMFLPPDGWKGSIGDHDVPEDSRLKSPTGLAFGPGEELYVADNSSDRIYRYSPDGGLTMAYGDKAPEGFRLKDPAGLAVDALGYVYVVDRDLPALMVFDRDLRPVFRVPSGSGRSPFDAPVGVTVAPNGDVLVVDEGQNQILVFN